MQKELLKLLDHPSPDFTSIRKLLTSIEILTLNASDFTPRRLHNFWIALRGQVGLKEIQWTMEDKNDEIDLLRKTINQLVKTECCKIPLAERLHITTKNQKVLEKAGFKVYLFEPNPYASVHLYYKLRINLAADSYPKVYERVARIICDLNAKYAFDLYTPPVQSFKLTHISEHNEAVVDLYQTLLSDLPDKEDVCRELLPKIEGEVNETWLRSSMRFTLSIEERAKLQSAFENARKNWESYKRLTQQAQLTLYPCSDHNQRDIRLFFFVRDLEIVLLQNSFEPSAALATDASIGRYVSFRLQLFEEGVYVPYDGDKKLLAKLKDVQPNSPAYLFLTQQTYTEYYCNLLESKTPEGVAILLQCCLVELTDIPVKLLLEDLIKQIRQNALGISDILKAYDGLLLELHDNAHPIDDRLIGISRCLDKVFAKERIALVVKPCAPVASLLAESYRKQGGILASTTGQNVSDEKGYRAATVRERVTDAARSLTLVI